MDEDGTSHCGLRGGVSSALRSVGLAARRPAARRLADNYHDRIGPDTAAIFEPGDLAGEA
jgi:hypothetical protein